MKRYRLDADVVRSIAIAMVFYVGLGLAAAGGGNRAAAPTAESGTEVSAEAVEAETGGAPAKAAEAETGVAPAKAAEAETGGTPAKAAEAETGGTPAKAAEAETGVAPVEASATDRPSAGSAESAEPDDQNAKPADSPGTVIREPDDNGVAPRVALTFDDGPHPVCTPKLLDGLKERGICATFFVIGVNIPGNEEILKRMDEEGHLIGNHTYDHVRIDRLSTADACAQLTKTSDLVRAITGKDTEYIRPPFGEWDKNMECGIQMFPVLWDVDTLDWTTKNVNEIVRRGIRDTHDGDIILMHDCYESSVEAALKITDLLLEQGYHFVTADAMILE